MKYLAVSCLGTSIQYFGSIITVDIIGMKYYYGGLLPLPFSLGVSFLLSKYWVFKKNNKIDNDYMKTWKKLINDKSERFVSCHHR